MKYQFTSIRNSNLQQRRKAFILIISLLFLVVNLLATESGLIAIPFALLITFLATVAMLGLLWITSSATELVFLKISEHHIEYYDRETKAMIIIEKMNIHDITICFEELCIYAYDKIYVIDLKSVPCKSTRNEIIELLDGFNYSRRIFYRWAG